MTVPTSALYQQHQLHYSPSQQEPRIVNGRVVTAKRNNAHLPNAVLEFRAKRQRRTVMATCTGGAMGLIMTGGPVVAVVCAVGAYAVATTVAKHLECRLLEQCLYSMHSKSGNKSHEDSRTSELSQEQKEIKAPKGELEDVENESKEESVKEDEAVAEKEIFKNGFKNMWKDFKRAMSQEDSLTLELANEPNVVVAPNYESQDVENESKEESVKVNEAVTEKESSKKTLKDPKRPVGTFFLYSQAHRTRVWRENPDATFGEIARILASQFKELPETEVRKWTEGGRR
jgi:HMG (high mobility group) box